MVDELNEVKEVLSSAGAAIASALCAAYAVRYELERFPDVAAGEVREMCGVTVYEALRGACKDMCDAGEMLTAAARTLDDVI